MNIPLYIGPKSGCLRYNSYFPGWRKNIPAIQVNI
jgi:hypothetical protein